MSVLVRFARYYAAVKHAPFQYGGGLPYTHHLAAVEAVARRFSLDDEEMLAACWLHDSVEDTGVKLKEIAELFGDRVAMLVGAVTNDATPGINRKARGLLTYPKTRSVPGAVKLKLADRIANVEHGGKLVEMYKKEYADFRHGLHGGASITYDEEMMWNHLDQLMGWSKPAEPVAEPSPCTRCRALPDSSGRCFCPPMPSRA